MNNRIPILLFILLSYLPKIVIFYLFRFVSESYGDLLIFLFGFNHNSLGVCSFMTLTVYMWLLFKWGNTKYKSLLLHLNLVWQKYRIYCCFTFQKIIVRAWIQSGRISFGNLMCLHWCYSYLKRREKNEEKVQSEGSNIQ